MRTAALLSFLLLFSMKGESRVKGMILTEFQRGNLPFSGPDVTTAYHQLNMRFISGPILGVARIEVLQHTEDTKTYQKLSQISLRYKMKGFDVTAGNFYAVLGRGLLLRAYELPSDIYEDEGYRIRYGFYRDIEGIQFQYKNRFFRMTAIRGRPLVNGLPPTVSAEERRPDLIETIALSTGPGRFQAGGIILRNTRPERVYDYFSGWTDVSFSGNIFAYLEMAKSLNGQPFFEIDNGSAHGFYGGLNWIPGTLGASLEYKDYHQFSLGSGFNDPPPLVLEQNYAVLNRSIHVVNLFDEQGIQTELFYRLPEGHLLTLNFSVSETKSVQSFGFREMFAEWWGNFDTAQIRVFGDIADDALRGEENRISGGVVLEKNWGGRWGGAIDVEGQTFQNDLDYSRAGNGYFRIQTVYDSKITFSMIVETSTDPAMTDRPDTKTVETAARIWTGWTLGIRSGSSHQLQFFYGKRRGGPACASGICYEVLDFNGFEFRWKARF
jgi:hypothetical protein